MSIAPKQKQNGVDRIERVEERKNKMEADGIE